MEMRRTSVGVQLFCIVAEAQSISDSRNSLRYARAYPLMEPRWLAHTKEPCDVWRTSPSKPAIDSGLGHSLRNPNNGEPRAGLHQGLCSRTNRCSEPRLEAGSGICQAPRT
jgi:hypothetical protein